MKSSIPKPLINCIITYCLLTANLVAMSQEVDSSRYYRDKVNKNLIKFNVSSFLLYDNCYMFSYERVLNRKKSISLFGGVQQFPADLKLGNDSAKLNKVDSRTGYAVGAEFRFYLSKENKYDAPRGVFIAPYISFVKYGNERTITYTHSNGTVDNVGLNTNIRFLNIGASLGYQFILWRRFVIDAVMFGPALTHYKFQADISGNLTVDEDGKLTEDIIEAIKDKLPMLGELIDSKSIERDGTQKFWAPGFRYTISIGYFF